MFEGRPSLYIALKIEIKINICTSDTDFSFFKNEAGTLLSSNSPNTFMKLCVTFSEDIVLKCELH